MTRYKTKLPEADVIVKGLAGSRDAGHAQAEIVAGATVFEDGPQMWAETTSRDRGDQVDGDDPKAGRASTRSRGR